MGKSLVIVESPAKAKTINKYLGNSYIVKSSVGHIRDLPTGGGTKTVDPKERAKKAAATRKLSPEAKAKYKAKQAKEQLIARMGVNPEKDWKAKYQILPGKEKVVAELKKLAKDADKSTSQRIWIERERLSLGICKKRLVAMKALMSVRFLTKSPISPIKKRLKSQIT